MDERDALVRNLKQLVELDRAAGIEFVLKGMPAPAAAPSAPSLRSTPATISNAPVAPRSVPPAPSRTPTFSATEGPDTLEKIAGQIATCRACGLCEKRRSTVPGEGNPQPELLFVGEGPGADEDASGRPFVGAAGQLLT